MLPTVTSPDFPSAFAQSWIANWNRRDVAAVLAHFDPDCVFESPVAQSVAGRSRLQGKADLESYWQAALSRIRSLEFRLDDLSWDNTSRTLVVFYTSIVDGRTTSCAELMRFDETGVQLIGRAYYGVSNRPSASTSRRPLSRTSLCPSGLCFSGKGNSRPENSGPQTPAASLVHHAETIRARAGPPYAGLLDGTGKSLVRRKCVVADAVMVEPVSEVFSLLTGKRTGKLAVNGDMSAA